MRKLIANRAVLYLGRQFAAGETLPASDQRMTEAWLRAGSAVWTEDQTPAEVLGEDPATEQDADPADEPDADPADEPDADPAAEPDADPTDEPGTDPAAEPSADPTAEPDADPAAEPDADPTNTRKTVTTHLDATHLVNTMKLDELKKLAADMGVDIGSAATKKAIAELIAAIEVTVGPDDDETGGTQ